MAKVIAVFDLEGTLCLSGKLIWQELVRRRYRQPGGIFRVVSDILNHLVISFLLKRRLIGEHKARLIAMESMASLLGGLKVAEVDDLAETISPKVLATLRPDMQKILNEHKERGHILLLASGQFQPFLEAIGRRLGVQATLGTGLKVKGSRYTGKVSTAICFAEQRVLRLQEYIRKNGLEVDLGQSYAYGDMGRDCPVLEMVGNPVAVYPDAELRAYAQDKGWKIIG